jgi:acyl-CoA synthetase (AMP-forming)/AMP-acid ligase II
MQTSLLLEMASDGAPDRLILGELAQGMTLAEAQARARGAAAWLSKQSGDTVVYLGLNSVYLPVTVFAAGLVGKPFAPINYRLSDEDLRKLLGRTAPSVAIVDDDMLPRVQGVAGVQLVAASEFRAACDDAGNRNEELPFFDPDTADIGVLLFTSGTTGEPKAAVLRHRNLTSYVISTVEFLGSDEDEAALVSVPPYHIAGISAILTGIYSGRRIVHMPAFTPEGWVGLAAQEKISHAMVVPTMMGRILDILEARGEKLPHLKALSYGGGRMPQVVIERALRLLPHVDFVNAYGLTETSSTIAVLGPDDHRQAMGASDPKLRRRLGSVGKPLPTLELEIRGPNGEVLPAGVSGEIYVRGEQVSGEYLSKKVIQDDGWFPTNDGGHMDEDGYLYVEGRLDDVIVRGGENMSPGEIEDVLRQHPNVSDVAVLGLPDNEWGEKVAAVVVVKNGQPSTDELAAFVKGRLRSSKTPEVWEFREILPYNDTGKLLRRVLKTELCQAAGQLTTA